MNEIRMGRGERLVLSSFEELWEDWLVAMPSWPCPATPDDDDALLHAEQKVRAES